MELSSEYHSGVSYAPRKIDLDDAFGKATVCLNLLYKTLENIKMCIHSATVCVGDMSGPLKMI